MEGYETAEASTAAEALDRLGHERFDAVFMDISLPDADGTAVIRRLRQEGPAPSVPIVALTGKTSDEDRRNISEAGASAYLSKPVDVKNLLRTLASVLEPVPAGEPSPPA
jgi:two-component system chemotaxis sensor kinase CheA